MTHLQEQMLQDQQQLEEQTQMQEQTPRLPDADADANADAAMAAAAATAPTASSHQKALPAAALRRIVAFTQSRADQLALLRVCRAWSPAVAAAIYAHLPLRASDAFERLNSLLHASSPSPLVPIAASIASLDISSAAADNVFMGDLDAALAKLPHLHAFRLEHSFHISNILVRSLAANCPSLTTLELPGCQGISDTFIGVLSENCPNLQRLDLAFTSTSIAALHTIVSNCANLIDLNLTECKDSDSTASLDLIFRGFSRPLSYLNLRNSPVSDALLRFVAVHCPALAILILESCPRISDNGLMKVINSCPDLEVLDCSFCDRLTDVSLQVLAIRAASTNGGRLQELHLAGCDTVSPPTVHQLVQKCTNLQLLVLDGCERLMGTFVQQLATYADDVSCTFEGSDVKRLAAHAGASAASGPRPPSVSASGLGLAMTEQEEAAANAAADAAASAAAADASTTVNGVKVLVSYATYAEPKSSLLPQPAAAPLPPASSLAALSLSSPPRRDSRSLRSRRSFHGLSHANPQEEIEAAFLERAEKIREKRRSGSVSLSATTATAISSSSSPIDPAAHAPSSPLSSSALGGSVLSPTSPGSPGSPGSSMVMSPPKSDKVVAIASGRRLGSRMSLQDLNLQRKIEIARATQGVLSGMSSAGWDSPGAPASGSAGSAGSAGGWGSAADATASPRESWGSAPHQQQQQQQQTVVPLVSGRLARPASTVSLSSNSTATSSGSSTGGNVSAVGSAAGAHSSHGAQGQGATTASGTRVWSSTALHASPFVPGSVTPGSSRPSSWGMPPAHTPAASAVPASVVGSETSSGGWNAPIYHHPGQSQSQLQGQGHGQGPSVPIASGRTSGAPTPPMTPPSHGYGHGHSQSQSQSHQSVSAQAAHAAAGSVPTDPSAMLGNVAGERRVLIASGRRRTGSNTRNSVSFADGVGMSASASASGSTSGPAGYAGANRHTIAGASTEGQWGADPSVWVNPTQLTSASSTWAGSAPVQSVQPVQQQQPNQTNTSGFVDPWAKHESGGHPSSSFHQQQQPAYQQQQQQPAYQQQPQQPAYQQPQRQPSVSGFAPITASSVSSRPASSSWLDANSSATNASTPPASVVSGTSSSGSGWHRAPQPSFAPTPTPAPAPMPAPTPSRASYQPLQQQQQQQQIPAFNYAAPNRGRMLLKLKIETRTGGHQMLAVHEGDDPAALAAAFCDHWGMADFCDALARLVSVRKAGSMRGRV
ncbi:hypothetical protein BC831DRAFT_73204 [Entophlyctis helioformis]|nr:hypothetical protein BC831DRAFT_73204 [Entophlyctis helioformis]